MNAQSLLPPALFGLILLSGCGKKAAPPAVVEPVDHTRPTAYYLDQGLPGLDRPWTATDYLAVQAGLEKIAQESTALLPHGRSTRSGPVFQHLVDPTNLDGYYNAGEAVDIRLLKVMQHFQAMGKINQRYGQAQASDPARAADSLQLMGYLLHLAKAAVHVVDDYLPTLDRQDPQMTSRMHGVIRMKSGLSAVVFGALLALEETQTYDAESRIALAREIGATYEGIAASLPEAYRTPYRDKIARLSEEADEEEIRIRMRELHGRISGGER